MIFFEKPLYKKAEKCYNDYVMPFTWNTDQAPKENYTRRILCFLANFMKEVYLL